MPMMILIICFVIGGCSTARVYREVLKEKPIDNFREFPTDKKTLHQATIRAVCSKNFIIEKDDEEKGFVLAKRFFQKGKKTIVVILQAKITSDEENKSSIYLSGLQTTQRLYQADRTRFLLWIIPLPGGGGKEATKVQEAETTIEDRKFYQDFFGLIEQEVKNLEKKRLLAQERRKVKLEQQAGTAQEETATAAAEKESVESESAEKDIESETKGETQKEEKQTEESHAEKKGLEESEIEETSKKGETPEAGKVKKEPKEQESKEEDTLEEKEKAESTAG